MRKFLLFYLVGLVIATICLGCSKSEEPTKAKITLQLNWLHDPTFTGEYLLAKEPSSNLTIREGGPNIFPLAELIAGRANIAVVGADIFLQALSKDYKASNNSELLCIFIDFQRNPVGWVLHPDAAKKAGLSNTDQSDQKIINRLFFQKVANKILQVGDKRGTETTSIWIQWRKLHNLPDDITVVPVGFDTSIVLSAPMLAYPVYLNEEPFKLTEKIGRPVVILDPAKDGITLYGNVLVTTKKFAEAHPGAIAAFQVGLRESWKKSRNNLPLSVEEVSKFYKGTSSGVLTNQIQKTLEFVFYVNQEAGFMDINRGGRWDDTLLALQQAKLVGKEIDLEILRKHLWPPK